MKARPPVVATLTALLSGCSFVFGGGPPAEHAQMPYFDCTSTMGLPVADGMFALSGVANAIMTFRQSEAEYKEKNGENANRNVTGGVAVVTAVVHGASAIYGIVQGHRCAAAKEALKARILTPMYAPPGAPRTLPPPPPLPAPAPQPPAAPQPTTPPATTPPPATPPG